jgi:hypothetical protein
MSRRDDILLLTLGAIVGILFAIVGLLVVNEVRFHHACEGTVLNDFWGDDYCVAPDVMDTIRKAQP